MPDAKTPPRSKRAVPTARVVAPRAKPHAAPAAVFLRDPTPSTRRGFRVPRPAPIVRDDADTEDTGTNYALRLTEALEAISSAQNVSHPHGESPAPRTAHDTSPAPRGDSPVPRRTKDTVARSPTGRGNATLTRLGDRFANLPPIRLPIGPAIPWRFGVPGLVLIVLAMIFVARPMSQADSQVSRLPTPAMYPVQQAAPLFTDALPTPAPVPAAPLGVADPGGPGFDIVDVGLKLIAVLALAYGSLLLLKRTGMGGAAAIKIAGKSSGLQVVSSLTLAPNRTVHLLKVPGGKTVLVGATPNQVNLIVDLGELESAALEPDAAGSFFDILKGKLPQ